MSEPLVLIWLAVMSLSLLIMAVALVVMARAVRTTLSAIDRLLPDVAHTFRESRRSVRQFRHWIVVLQRATQQVHGVIQRACDLATDAVDQWEGVQRRVWSLWSGRGHGARDHHGNGARVEPRSQARRRAGTRRRVGG